jgi:diguanylate cyclase (GGDEF)-like protein
MSIEINKSTFNIVCEMRLALKKDMFAATGSGLMLFAAFLYFQPVRRLYMMTEKESYVVDVTTGFLFSFFIVVSYFTVKRLAEMRRFFKDAMSLSRMDFLTEVYNRRALFEILEMEFNKIKRFPDGNFCLLFFDIDNFKGINDNHGHAVGDTVLRETAKTVVATLRKTDVIGRFGGDEFAIILPYTDINKGVLVAEKLRENVSRLMFGHVRNRFNITLSIGIVPVPLDDNVDTFEKLIEEADKYLYLAKKKGRNRVESPIG